MPGRSGAAAAAAALAVLSVAGCTAVEESTSSSGPEAAVLEPVDEERSRLVLTKRAVERLGLQTVPVAGGRGGASRSVPYAAVLYDAQGQAWTYTTDRPLSFLRAAVAVDRFSGDTAFLTEGPPVGTQVVTTGAAELFGTELDVGK